MPVRHVASLLVVPVLFACSKPAALHEASPPPVASSTTSPSTPAAPAASASAATSPSAAALFPPVGTKLTFRGAMRDGTPDTWSATITALDGELLQYEPHHDVVNSFTKAGFRTDASGIYVAGESLEGRGPTTRVVALPFTAKASAELPSGMFSATYTVAGKESVTVPAGKFEAWRVLVKDKLNPEAVAWIAPGSGIVKIRISTGRVDELIAIETPK